MHKNIIAIVQARMGSTRLRGKVMAEIGGVPMLRQVVDRLRYCSFIDDVIVATSSSVEDGIIAEFCTRNGIGVFRGSEEDVLKRYYDSARNCKAQVVVRITADCPLIDPKITDKVIYSYIKNLEKYDGASNVIKRTYPRGLDTEVVSFECLETCHNEALEKSDREHVTAFTYSHPGKFKIYNVEHEKNLSHMRWTVDEPDDLKFVREIYKRLYRPGQIFYMEDVIRVLENEPELAAINKQVKQKSLR